MTRNSPLIRLGRTVRKRPIGIAILDLVFSSAVVSLYEFKYSYICHKNSLDLLKSTFSSRISFRTSWSPGAQRNDDHEWNARNIEISPCMHPLLQRPVNLINKTASDRRHLHRRRCLSFRSYRPIALSFSPVIY